MVLFSWRYLLSFPIKILVHVEKLYTQCPKKYTNGIYIALILIYYIKNNNLHTCHICIFTCIRAALTNPSLAETVMLFIFSPVAKTNRDRSLILPPKRSSITRPVDTSS